MTPAKKLSILLSGAVFIVLATSASAIDSRTRKEVLARVQPLGAEIKWNTKAVEELDINCDGKMDYAVGGRNNNRFLVAVALGPLNQITSALSLEIPIGTNEDGALCEKAPKLVIQSLDYDPADLLGSTPEGFVRSETCNEIGLGGECVKYHIYWDHTTNKLSSWK